MKEAFRGSGQTREGAAGSGNSRCKGTEGGMRRQGNLGSYSEFILTEVGVLGIGLGGGQRGGEISEKRWEWGS